MILWTDMFLEAQGYPVKENILHQDNKSTIFLLNNSKQSSTTRTRAINIHYLFMTDQIQKASFVLLVAPLAR